MTPCESQPRLYMDEQYELKVKRWDLETENVLVFFRLKAAGIKLLLGIKAVYNNLNNNFN